MFAQVVSTCGDRCRGGDSEGISVEDNKER
jgi:hypothetical protein